MLLSGDELLTIAEEDTKQKENRLRNLVYGLLDCSIAIFLFLPFFGQKDDGIIQAVSLTALTECSLWLKGLYFIVVILTILLGILLLALQDCRQTFWVKNKAKLSVLLNAAGTMLFIVSQQVYAAAFMFIFLMIKILLLVKIQ